MSPRRSARLASTPARAPPADGSRGGRSARHTTKKHEFEFCGPVLGPAAMLVGLPAVCYALLAACNDAGCVASVADLARPGAWPGLPAKLVSGAGFAAVGGWFALQAAVHILLPGARRQGVVLASGKRLEYKLTGTTNLLLTLAAAAASFAWTPAGRRPPLAWAYDHYAELLTAAVALSTLLAVLLYAASFRRRLPRAGLAPHGATGWRLYDFFMGRELNPRALSPRWPAALRAFDWKEFCELYPGLLGWLVLDLACAAKQIERTGAVSPAMALVCAFHAIYVADALAHEPAILTTMDITTDGFGFMLAFGDLAWVPFTYSLQARYLADHASHLSPFAVAAILALNVAGYAIFRGSNSQKDAFRTDPTHPSVAHLRTLSTSTGRKLIVSGWWGLARHINYFGDWVLAWSWCLPCGVASPVPFFYVAYFGALLLHRDRRDGAACAAKYGKDWDAYCALVPWRIVPFVY